MTTQREERADPRAAQDSVTERHAVRGEQLLARVRQLVHQGNIRRIIILAQDGRTLIEIPLTLGVVGAMLMPVWVAIGAMAALAADYTILVEKTEPAPSPDW
jgi:hypothetical protein